VTPQSKVDQIRAPAKGGCLLDTSVISEVAPGRQNHLSQAVADWFVAHDERLFLPTMAVAELSQGIAKLRRSGGVDRANRLDFWLNGLIEQFGDRILPLDPPVARLAGQMSDAAIAIGRHPGFADIAIAATAQHHGLTLLTRNLKHFQPLGVACADPFE
jgi:toxin FitB